MEPRLQVRWELVASVAEVLLEADRVEQALKKAPTSVTGMIHEYAEGTEPWCLLDTHHPHMESLWYNFEPQIGGDYDSIEKLIVRARQRYMEVGSSLAQNFMICLDKEKLSSKGIIRHHEIFEKHVKPSLGKEKLAYLWVDALRFEMARAIRVLIDFGIERIFLASDHGYVFADELSDDMKIEPPGGETAG